MIQKKEKNRFQQNCFFGNPQVGNNKLIKMQQSTIINIISLFDSAILLFYLLNTYVVRNVYVFNYLVYSRIGYLPFFSIFNTTFFFYLFNLLFWIIINNCAQFCAQKYEHGGNSSMAIIRAQKHYNNPLIEFLFF